jgi:hypothetical protein
MVPAMKHKEFAFLQAHFLEADFYKNCPQGGSNPWRWAYDLWHLLGNINPNLHGVGVELNPLQGS